MYIPQLSIVPDQCAMLKNRLRLHQDMELLLGEAGEPAITAVGKGHDWPELRRVWVSGELAGYTAFMGWHRW